MWSYHMHYDHIYAQTEIIYEKIQGNVSMRINVAMQKCLVSDKCWKMGSLKTATWIFCSTKRATWIFGLLLFLIRHTYLGANKQPKFMFNRRFVMHFEEVTYTSPRLFSSRHTQKKIALKHNNRNSLEYIRYVSAFIQNVVCIIQLIRRDSSKHSQK